MSTFKDTCSLCGQPFNSTVSQKVVKDMVRSHQSKRTKEAPFECACGYKNCLEGSMWKKSAHATTDACDWWAANGSTPKRKSKAVDGGGLEEDEDVRKYQVWFARLILYKQVDEGNKRQRVELTLSAPQTWEPIDSDTEKVKEAKARCKETSNALDEFKETYDEAVAALAAKEAAISKGQAKLVKDRETMGRECEALRAKVQVFNAPPGVLTLLRKQSWRSNLPASAPRSRRSRN